MNNIFRFLALFSLVGNAFAQSDVTVSGRVLVSDEESADVAITVRTAENDEIVTGAITDTEGRFILRGLASDEYIVDYSAPGFQTDSTSC